MIQETIVSLFIVVCIFPWKVGRRKEGRERERWGGGGEGEEERETRRKKEGWRIRKE